ncbi:hypothetical protein PLESTF_001955900 [Pleodorina starrii]|nr:hypothetical protein PLESTF_001955900 [Pleodorina starrii]
MSAERLYGSAASGSAAAAVSGDARDDFAALLSVEIDAAEEEEAYSKKVLSKAQKIEALSEANVKSVISAAGLRLGVQDLAVVASEQLLQQHSVDTQSKKVAHDTAVQKLSALRQHKAAFVIATGGFLSGDPVVDALFGAPAAGAPPPATASAYAAAPLPFGVGDPAAVAGPRAYAAAPPPFGVGDPAAVAGTAAGVPPPAAASAYAAAPPPFGVGDPAAVAGPAAGAPPPVAASAYAAAPPPFGAGAPEHDPYQFYDDVDEDPAAVAGMPGPAPTNSEEGGEGSVTSDDGDDDPVTRWTRWMEWE